MARTVANPRYICFREKACPFSFQWSVSRVSYSTSRLSWRFTNSRKEDDRCSSALADREIEPLIRFNRASCWLSRPSTSASRRARRSASTTRRSCSSWERERACSAVTRVRSRARSTTSMGLTDTLSPTVAFLRLPSVARSRSSRPAVTVLRSRDSVPLLLRRASSVRQRRAVRARGSWQQFVGPRVKATAADADQRLLAEGHDTTFVRAALVESLFDVFEARLQALFPRLVCGISLRDCLGIIPGLDFHRRGGDDRGLRHPPIFLLYVLAD